MKYLLIILMVTVLVCCKEKKDGEVLQGIYVDGLDGFDLNVVTPNVKIDSCEFNGKKAWCFLKDGRIDSVEIDNKRVKCIWDEGGVENIYIDTTPVGRYGIWDSAFLNTK